MRFKNIVPGFLAVFLMYCQPFSAEAVAVHLSAGATTAAPDTAISLPVRPPVKISKRKQARAQKLSQWVIHTLESQQVNAAVITREGPPLTILADRTGMTHSAFVFRDPQTSEWTTYGLYSDTENGYQTSLLWKQSLYNFYAEQSGYKTDTLILIPTQEMQTKLFKRLSAQPFQGLLPRDQHYNLIAPLESPNSFNCTKWVVLQLYAAQLDSNNTQAIIHRMTETYKEPVKNPFFILRYFLQNKPDVDWSELSPPNRIHTVTVNSLLKSSLFEKHLYYHERLTPKSIAR